MWHDLKIAARSLSRARAFALAVVLTLALGIGATSAIFSVVNAVLLDALPYKDPDRLLVISGRAEGVGAPGYPTSLLDLASIREGSRTIFSEVSPVTATRSFNLASNVGESVEHVSGEMVTDNYFVTYGVPMALGRAFEPREVAAPGVPVMVLSYELWDRRFGRSPDVLNKAVSLNEQSYNIIGVAAKGFKGLTDEAQLWLPMGLSNVLYGAHYTEMRQFRWLRAVARLAPGVSFTQAQRALDAIGAGLRTTFPQENEKIAFAGESLNEQYIGGQRKSLLSMFGASAFVLLIGCANIANLLLARAVTKRRELAVRVALGAGRTRLVRQAVSESVLLGASGLVLGLLLAFAGARALVATGAIPLLSFANVSIDLQVIGVSIAITLLCVIAFGTVPAMVALRVAPREGLGDVSRGTTMGRKRGMMQRILIGSEVALATLLLSGAGLMTKGFAGFQQSDLGFNANELHTLRIDLTAERYRSNDAVWGLVSRLSDDLKTMPQIRSAAFEGPGYPTSGWYQIHFTKPDARDARDQLGARRHHITPGYFSTLGIKLLAGRDFSPQDIANAPRVIIVGEHFAKTVWPGESPLGKELRTVGPTPVSVTVIGVVADVDHGGLQAGDRAQDDLYISALQSPPRSPAMLTLFIRSSAPLASLQEQLQKRLHAIDSYLPFFDVRSMSSRLADQTATGRLLVRLMLTFAVLGIVLAAVGVFGVISYTVTQRTREIGVRLALGARPGMIHRQIVGSALIPVGAGLGVGLIGVFVMQRFVTALLYGVAPSDPSILFGTVVLLLLVGVAASWWPARNAAAVQPTTALRDA